MSSGQKQQAGQGQFPVLFSEKARNITDRNKLQNYRFWTGDFWENQFRGLMLRFSNSIAPEQSSAAISIVENLPFYIHRKPGEDSVRWGMQVPMARKMLCIIDDNETLVNFSYALEQGETYSRNVYRNGNFANRRDIADFFQMPDVDGDVIRKDMENKKAAYLESLTEEEREIGSIIAEKSLRDQVKDNIFHSMMEYILTDLTGLDEIEHNRQRKANFPAFQQLILTKLKQRNEAYYQTKLEKEIDPAGAKEVAALLAHLSSTLVGMKNSPDDFRAFVDNWALDDNVLRTIKYSNKSFEADFDNYANKHLMISVMSGMAVAETPIKESKPFLGLQEERYPLYDNGVLVENAKKRERTSLETLNDTVSESKFTPNYLNVSEEVCDNYFRLGFVGIYVSNKKTEGFSDRNLHTVINLAENTLSKTNSPDTLIQGIGRNRGLDETIVPTYIHALGRKQKSIFDLKNLKKDDYYPALFKAQSKFNKKSIKVLGNNVGQEIIEWFNANFDKDETIDNDKLKRQVLKIIARALRNLNNNNSHNIKLSRRQMTQVIGVAMKTLNGEIKRINEPYKLSFFVKVIGSVLNFLSEIYYSFKRIRPALKMKKHALFGDKQDMPSDALSPSNPDDVYIKIIKNTNFKTIIEKISVAREFKDWMARKSVGIETTFKKNIESYLNADVKDMLNKHQQDFIQPLLSKFVVASKKEMLLAAFKNIPDFIGFFEANQALLAEIFNSEEDKIEEKVLRLLHKIPGLDVLTTEDIVNYPKQMQSILDGFAKGPLALITGNTPLKDCVVQNIALYLRGPFLNKAAALFLDADLNQLQNILLTTGNAESFLNHLLTKANNEPLDIENFEVIIAEFKAFFKLSDFESIDVRAKECAVQWEEELAALNGNTFGSLDKKKISEFANIIKKQLLPSVVNVFPLNNRASLLTEATSEKIEFLLATEGDSFIALMNNSSEVEFAIALFTKLSTSVLPKVLNIEEEAEKGRIYFAEQLQAILAINQAELLLKKMASLAISGKQLEKPQYIYDLPVQELLMSEAFLNSLSLLLPFDQWQQLKTEFHANSAASLGVAQELIDTVVGGNQNLVTPEYILQLINKHLSTNFISAKNAAQAAMIQLDEIQKSIASNPLASLSEETQGRFIALTRDKVLPLLASFIADKSKRNYFLANLPSNPVILQFLFQNKEQFAELGNDNPLHAKPTALALINQLTPAEYKFTIEQLVHPPQQAEEQGKSIANDIILETLLAYLSSAHFLNVLESFYNPLDFERLSVFLQNNDKRIALAQKMIDKGLDTIDAESVLTLLQSDESLKDIKPLNKRMDDFNEFVSRFETDGFANMDKKKTSDLIVNSLAPIVFHKKLHGTLKSFLGYLSSDDLTVMLESMGVADAKKEALQIVTFMNVIKTKNKKALQTLFLSFPGEGNLDFDDLPLKKTLDNIGNLLEEILDCQGYYNQHDRKGDQGSNLNPRLVEKISPELKDIRVDANYSFLSGFSRKIFFIQGIRNGLPASGEINADSNQSRVKIFERINAHILRPLWWGTNASKVSYFIIKTGRDIAYGLKAAGFAIINVFKKIGNFVTNNYFNVSKRNQASANYNDTAFDFAKEMNGLRPLNRSRVAKPDCPFDVVSDLESTIGSSRHRFFSSQEEGDADADKFSSPSPGF